MPDKLTYTGKIGPGNTITTLVFDDVEYLRFDHTAKILEVSYGEPEKVQFLDINATTTVSDTITSGVHAWIVSQ